MRQATYQLARVHSVLTRSNVLELHILRDLLMHKYGREFSAAVMENRDGIVTERVSPEILPGDTLELVQLCMFHD